MSRFRIPHPLRSRARQPADASSASDALRRADDLARAGRVLEAIDVLTDANRRERAAAIDERLVRLRYDAVATVSREPAAEWPRRLADPFPDVEGRPPEITAAELDAATLGGGILHHGCLLVRGLLSDARVAQLSGDIDFAFAARDAGLEGAPIAETSPWYLPFEAGGDVPPFGDRLRTWVRSCGGLWAADSPAALFDVLDALGDAHVPEVVSEYLGERALLSVNKCTLRRVPVDAYPSWHQDGAFLGAGVRTVDVWIALTPCGGDRATPGLDIVPRRLDALLPANTGDAMVKHAVGSEQVAVAAAGVEPIRPEFDAGDALLFDDLFLHCTGTSPGMTKERYALESWFFTASTVPAGYVPIVA